MVTTNEEMEKKFSIKYLPQLEFSCDKILQKVEKRCIRKLQHEKYRKTNQWVTGLYERDLQFKKEPAFEIKKVSSLVGQGVFARKKIPELSFCGEYTGVVRKRSRRTDRDNDYIFGYIIGPRDTKWVIDAREKGNYTRFINHSDSPNLTSRWMISGGVCHIILFTNRLIHPGEQLTYDYGPLYWRDRSYPLQL